jgi:hypothetical protein
MGGIKRANGHILGCRLAEQQVSRSRLYAFPLHFLQRTVHILQELVKHFQMGSHFTLTSDEERVARKHHALISILEIIAYAVLGVTWCVQRFDCYPVSNLKFFSVLWCLGCKLTVFASNYCWSVELFEL